MDIPSMIEVLEAALTGKPMQAYAKPGFSGHEKVWTDVTPNWDFYRCDFRVKPEPRQWRVCMTHVVGSSASIFVPVDGKYEHEFCPNCITVKEVIE